MNAFIGILFILICVMLIGIILLQKGRGGGLSGAFGGAGGHSAFGSRTGDMFTWITVVLTGLFLLVGSAAARKFIPPHEQVTAEAVTDAAPAAPAADTPAAAENENADVESAPEAASTDAAAEATDDAASENAEAPAAPADEKAE